MGIYLDNAATTPTRPEVITKMNKVMQEQIGNPSSVHTFGRQANMQVRNARKQIADSIGALEDEIIFTSSGSEGDNLALLKGAESMKKYGKHIITSAIEHPAVLNTIKYLETKGFEVTYLPVDYLGNISLKQVQEAYRDDTILVSLMFGNNEIGTIFPILEIANWLEDKQALFHTDAVQGYSILDIDVQKIPVDMLTVAAHKINGPKGIGFLYVKKGTSLLPLIHGGEQERKMRAGTENVPAIVGFAKAVEFLTPELKEEKQVQFNKYKELIIDSLKEAKIEFEINGDLNNSLAHILSLAISGLNSQILLTRLDLKGYAVSAGSACTAGNIEKSHVLTAMYGDDVKVDETIRISFGYQTTKNDIEEFITDLKNIIIDLKH